MNDRKKFMFILIISVGISLSFGIPFFLSYTMEKSDYNSSVQSISIIAVGDSIGYNIQDEDLSHLGEMIYESDIFIFNLEGIVVDSKVMVLKCEGFPNQSIFTANSSFVEKLKLAPITIGNLANNHIMDCGPEGIKTAKKILLENNILSVGAGQNLEEACEPLFVDVKDLRFAFVSYNFVTTEVSADANKAGSAHIDRCQHDYGKIRSQGIDHIIASIHYGSWSPVVNEGQVNLVNKLFDLGADIVIGHSPHMPQAIMVEDGKIAFFSVGNFILRPDYEMPPLAHTTIFPRIEFYQDRIDVTIYPVKIDNDGIPHFDNSGEIISRIASDSKDFNTFLEIRDNLGYLSISGT